MITTTLDKIREHRPCESGWKKLLAYLGKTEADDEPLALLTILESNGVEDAIWAFRALPEYSAKWRHYTVDCVERVQHLITDPRSLEALRVARLHADGLATDDQLTQACRAAAAIRDATAATYAATAAAYAAAAYAAHDATAANATAAAIRDAAYAAATDAEREWQANRLKEYLS